VHPTQLTNTVTTSSNVIVSSSTFSTGTYSLSRPSQFSTPLTLGDIARALGESAQITEITETTQLTETTESPDQHLI
jgi:DNA-binding IscR family transcriptional regulator